MERRTFTRQQTDREGACIMAAMAAFAILGAAFAIIMGAIQ